MRVGLRASESKQFRLVLQPPDLRESTSGNIQVGLARGKKEPWSAAHIERTEQRLLPADGLLTFVRQ